MKKSLIITSVLFSLLTWQCTRTEEVSLKNSLEDGVAKVNAAVATISESKGFELILSSDDETKSEEVYNDSISLDLVSGIYDFQPHSFYCHRSPMPFWFFKKVGESDSMIVHMPKYMAYHPKHLHDVNPPDSTPANNFTINASDYHFYYSYWRNFGYDYKLTAGLVLDTTDIGKLDIEARGESFSDNSYTYVYTFTDDYSVKVSFEAGDTATKSFALLEGDDVLMQETVVYIWKDYHQSEREYTLTLGDISIVRSTEIDSIQVYLNGVLQSNAAVRITDSTDTEHSICHHRDILLTFDDGSTAKLSELIEPAFETLKTLVPSMHSMRFARRVVDYIALTIYYRTYYF